VVQILAQTRGLLDHYVRRSLALPAPLERDMSKSLRAVLQRMHAPVAQRSGAVAPTELFSALKARFPIFKGNGQQDSEELYRRLLDALHEDAKAVDKKSTQIVHDDDAFHKLPDEQKARLHRHLAELERREGRTVVADTFGSVMVTRVTCLHCGFVSLTEEEALDIQLQLPTRCHSLALGRRAAANVATKTPKANQGAKSKKKRLAKVAPHASCCRRRSPSHSP